MKRAVIAALVAWAALASPAAAAGEIVLELWDGITATDGLGIEELVNRFNQEHAGRIRVERTPTVWEELYPKVAVAVAGGVAPDIWIMHRENVPTQVLNGVLQPIDEYFEEAGLTDDHFLPGLAEGGFYGGRRYTVPMDVHPLLLYYNANHIAEAGLPGPPSNSAEHLEWARKLTRRDGDQVRWGARIISWGWLSWSILRQFGSAAFGGENFEDVVIMSEGTRRALEYAYDMVHTFQLSGPSWMFDGNVSMQADGIWWLGEVQRLRSEGGLNIHVAPADRIFGDVQPAVFAGSHMFSFPRQTRIDPERMRAAFTFIKWMGAHNAEWATYGQLPAWREAATSAEFRQMEDHMKIAFQAFDFPPPVPWGQSHLQIEQMFEMVIGGEGAPAVAMEQAHHALTVHRDEIRRQMEEAPGL